MLFRSQVLSQSFASVKKAKMKFATIFATVAICTIVHKCNGKSKPKPSCSYPPSQWCRSLEIAIECKVSVILLFKLKCSDKNVYPGTFIKYNQQLLK